MSRVGNEPVAVPDGVEIVVGDGELTVRGPRGELSQHVPDGVRVVIDDDAGEARVERLADDRESRARHGLVRALLANLVTGVSEGFTRELELVGVGYRARAAGGGLEMNVGYSHPVRIEAPEGVELAAPEANRITVTGNDKQQVGQVAADIRAVRPPEPYKGKGIRYAGEQVRRKAGKAGAA